MDLDPERQEIVDLLTRATRTGPLPPEAESRLRALMAPRNPSAPRLAWDELYRAGLFMVGVWWQFEPETIRIQA